jgi:hypothetical protein
MSQNNPPPGLCQQHPIDSAKEKILMLPTPKSAMTRRRFLAPELLALPHAICSPLQEVWSRQPGPLLTGLLYRHNIGTNRRGVVCSSSVTSGWNTDLRAMEWLVSRDIESDISLSCGDDPAVFVDLTVSQAIARTVGAKRRPVNRFAQLPRQDQRILVWL